MSDKAWIKIFGKFLKWEWYKDSNTKDLFLHCLLKANWKEAKFIGKIIPRGSFVTSRKKLSEELGISEQSIRTSINRLKLTNEITIQTTNKFTIINVVNYDKYQKRKEEVTNQTTDTISNKQPTTNQQLTTIEEYKNNKNIKNNKKCVCNNNTPTLEIILNFAIENFQGYSKNDIETSCNKFFNFYEEREWENVKKWENKLNLWINEDIKNKKIKKDEVENIDDRAKRIFGSN